MFAFVCAFCAGEITPGPENSSFVGVSICDACAKEWQAFKRSARDQAGEKFGAWGGIIVEDALNKAEKGSGEINDAVLQEVQQRWEEATQS